MRGIRRQSEQYGNFFEPAAQVRTAALTKRDFKKRGTSETEYGSAQAAPGVVATIHQKDHAGGSGSDDMDTWIEYSSGDVNDPATWQKIPDFKYIQQSGYPRQDLSFKGMTPGSSVSRAPKAKAPAIAIAQLNEYSNQKKLNDISKAVTEGTLDKFVTDFGSKFLETLQKIVPDVNEDEVKNFVATETNKINSPASGTEGEVRTPSEEASDNSDAKDESDPEDSWDATLKSLEKSLKDKGYSQDQIDEISESVEGEDLEDEDGNLDIDGFIKDLDPMDDAEDESDDYDDDDDDDEDKEPDTDTKQKLEDAGFKKQDFPGDLQGPKQWIKELPNGEFAHFFNDEGDALDDEGMFTIDIFDKDGKKDLDRSQGTWNVDQAITDFKELNPDADESNDDDADDNGGESDGDEDDATDDDAGETAEPATEKDVEPGNKLKGKDKDGKEQTGTLIKMIFGKPKIKTDSGDEVMLSGDFEKVTSYEEHRTGGLGSRSATYNNRRNSHWS